MNVKIILQYDGSRFDGWQKQGNTENTIQGRLEAVLEKMCGYPVEVHGSGRTAGYMRWGRRRIFICRTGKTGRWSRCEAT